MWAILMLGACEQDPDPTDGPPAADTSTSTDSPPDDTATPTGPTGDTALPTPTGDTGTAPIPSLCTVANAHRITAAVGLWATPAIGPDQNGDGCGDVWFSTFGNAWHVDEGQPSDLTDATLVGVVHAVTPTSGGVWSGTAGGTWWVTAVPTVPTDPSTIAAGSVTGVLGDAILPIGDLDGDGLEDLIVSDTTLHGIGWWTAPFERTQTADDALAFWRGIERFGGSRSELHPAGDLTGDGLPDLLVGAPYSERVYLLSDPPRAPAALADVAVASGATSIVGETHLGSGVATGDLDGDGVEEWVASDEFEGEAYAVPGSWVGQLDLTTAPMILTWQPFGAQGGDVAIGDLDGDGDDDLALGAPWRGGYYSNRGEVLVAWGPLAFGVTDLDATATVLTASDPDRLYFGRELVVGDLDPDPGLELVVGGQIGDPSSYTGGPDLPAVWIYPDL